MGDGVGKDGRWNRVGSGEEETIKFVPYLQVGIQTESFGWTLDGTNHKGKVLSDKVVGNIP